MKKLILSLVLLGAAASTPAFAQDFGPVGAASFVQLAPVTNYSTIACANFAKQPDGAWEALGPQPFTLGIITGIIPPIRPIKVGGFIYNNVDLYTQLELQCSGSGAVVRARY